MKGECGHLQGLAIMKNMAKLFQYANAMKNRGKAHI